MITGILCIDPSLIALGGVLVAVAVAIHYFEPGLWEWIHRGGPDYLEANAATLEACRRCGRAWTSNKSGICGECWNEFDALLETADPDAAAEAMGDDFQQGFNRRDWPRDTGTR